MTTLDLTQQTAVITGAARGIGFAITKRLLDSAFAARSIRANELWTCSNPRS